MELYLAHAGSQLLFAIKVDGGQRVSRAHAAGGQPGQRVRDRYAALLELLELDVSIDVLSGTSAGGINAALLGLAAACGYALTAALMKNAVADLDEGVVGLFTNWHIYGVAVAGVIPGPFSERHQERLGDQVVSGLAADPAGQIAVNIRCVAVEERREPVGFGA